MAPPTIPPLKRFAAKYEINLETGCWIWTASLMPNGYAQFRYRRGKNGYGHRFAYEYYVGEIPQGRTLDHLCRRRSCVNPAHLEVVTVKENVLRGKGKGAQNAAKTHCPHGHPYDEENTYVNPKTKRRTCRTCQAEYRESHRDEIREYQRAYMQKYGTEYARKRYQNDPAYREQRKQAMQRYRDNLRADAKRWRESQT